MNKTIKQSETRQNWSDLISTASEVTQKCILGNCKTDHTPRSLLAKNEHKDDNKRKDSLLLRDFDEPFEWSGISKTSK